MCGRYTLTSPAQVLAEAFGVEILERIEFDLEPRFNIAPSQSVPIVRVAEKSLDRELVGARWGLVPPFIEKPGAGPLMINARAETVASKPAFRRAFKSRRCIVPADGFYEWQAQPGGGRKQPHYIRAGEGIFGMAGLWEVWRGGEGERIESCTVLTTEPNELMRPLHDRMPVILHPDQYARWLDPQEQDPTRLQELLRPFPEGGMRADPVGLLVNDVRNDDARLVATVEAVAARPPAQGALF